MFVGEVGLVLAQGLAWGCAEGLVPVQVTSLQHPHPHH